MRLQQMYQTNLVQNIADIGIAGTKTMACCANGITSSIEPVRSLHAPRSHNELGVWIQRKRSLIFGNGLVASALVAQHGALGVVRKPVLWPLC